MASIYSLSSRLGRDTFRDCGENNGSAYKEKQVTSDVDYCNMSKTVNFSLPLAQHSQDLSGVYRVLTLTSGTLNRR